MRSLSRKLILSFAVVSSAQAAWALVSLDDQDLSVVTAQDGVTVTLESSNSGVSATSIKQTLDAAQILTLGNMSLVGKSNINNVTVGDAPVRFINTFDVGTNGAGQPEVAYTLKLDSAARLRINDLTLGTSPRSLGTMALEANSAQLKLTNVGGPLNYGNAGGGYLFGEILNASMYYRQLSSNTAPYLVMDNMNLRWEIPKATLGMTSQGLFMGTLDKVASPSTPLQNTLLNLELGFDLKYRNPAHGAGSEFVRNDPNAGPLINFAWKGSVKDARLLWAAGGSWNGSGVWTNPAANTSEGLRLNSRWNYVNHADATGVLGENALTTPSEFRWRFGEAGGQRLSIELSDWNNMPGVLYAHSFPMIALDVLAGGAGPGGNATTSSLCWGGAVSSGSGACTGAMTDKQNLRLQAGQVRNYGLSNTNYDSLGVLVRGANLLSYSNKIKLVEGTTVRAVKDWGLIYTLANLDGNIYLYPGGNPADLNKGIIADISLVSQTLDASGNQVTGPWGKWNGGSGSVTTAAHDNRWNRGTHLMIADTTACSRVSCDTGETGMGIGLIGSSILLMANDTRLWVKPYSYLNDSSYYDGGIDLLSPQMRMEVKGTFGGGTIPYGKQIVTGGLVGVNAEGLLNMRISPSAPSDASHFLGYSMAARLYDISNGTLYTQDSNVIASGKGSYVSFAEQNRPDKPLLLGGISGDFAITNGKVNLVNATETEGIALNDGYYKLRISNDILFGTQANARLLEGTDNGTRLPGGTTAQPFRINDVSFGGDKLGSVVIPSGQWHYSATLRPQCIGNGSC